MGNLSNIVIRFFELLEAEGRVAKRNAMLVIRSFLYLYFGAVFILVGVMVGFTILYLWLRTYSGVYVAGTIVAILLLAIGLIMMCKGKPWAKNIPSGIAKAKKDGGDIIEKQ